MGQFLNAGDSEPARIFADGRHAVAFAVRAGEPAMAFYGAFKALQGRYQSCWQVGRGSQTPIALPRMSS